MWSISSILLGHGSSLDGKVKTIWGGSGETLVQMYCSSALTVGV